MVTCDEAVHVSAVTKNDSLGSQRTHANSTPELSQICSQYQDCFPEVLPDGLPLERDAAHITPTQSGVPPFKPIHWLSPAGNAEVEHQIAEGVRRGINWAQLITRWGTGLVCQREGWQSMHVCRLQSSQQDGYSE